MATYDSLHRQCRTLESLFDAKLTSYSRLASTISRNDSDVEASGSGERWKDLQNEVEDLLENVCCDSIICVAPTSDDFACCS
jgi:Golgi SNAP receptor complex protein 1